EQNMKQELAIEKERVRYIDLPVGMNRKYLFHYLSSFKMFRMMFSSVKDTREKKFPVVTSILVLIFLIFSFISFAPYIKITERQKKLEGIDNEMKQIFLSTFPDVHNVVNPLLQAREKIQRNEGVDIKAGVPSVLKIMADITLLFPENIDARIDVFRIVGDTITISGTMDSLKTLEIVKKRIEQSERFVITGMGTISFDERNRLNFTMTLKIV
ncbi:MAG: hypothetical protein PHI44_03100, partial [Candidatus Ratteibacteria bacterium]|nr:hypothetical protein [Candidatus Ratteibacteria bacterium]